MVEVAIAIVLQQLCRVGGKDAQFPPAERDYAYIFDVPAYGGASRTTSNYERRELVCA